jgi:hypothetical protein
VASTIDQPSFLVEMSYATGAPTWVTIPNLRAWDSARGRNDELGQIQAGTLNLLVGNPTGDLSPGNTGGAHYPFTPVGRSIRLSATYNSIQYFVLRGFVQSWEPVDNTVMDSDIKIGVVDWFNLANLGNLNATFGVQDEGARIAAALALVNTRSLPTSVETGTETILGATLVETPLLQHINDILAGERGLFFCAADGTLTYHTRNHRFFTARSNTSQGTFNQSQAANALNYINLKYVYDDRFIYNSIRVTASGSDGLQTASDGTSDTRYGTRVYALTAPYLTAGQALPLAQWLLAGYKDAHPRVVSIDLDSDANPAGLLPHQLGREIGDRITIAKNLPGVLGLSQDFWVEGIKHAWSADANTGVRTTWLLSDPASYGPTPWRLDVTLLDSATPLGY